MENNAVHKTHPLVLIAAAAVTVASLAGIGAVFGLIPVGKSAVAPEPTAAVVADPATPASTASPAELPPAATAATVDTPKTAPRPARNTARPASRRVETARRPSAEENYRASRENSTPVRAEARPAATCRDCGVIASVREVTREADPSGVGAVAGGVLGGVVGNQMGKGRGRDAMTVIGAVGGAVAGHQIEKSQRATREYRITIRFDDGTTQVITQPTEPVWRDGDRVRVSGGQIVSL